MEEKRITPEVITHMKPDEVFVFGANIAGIHGAGAALLAVRQFGAIQGQGVGLQGRSYAIPTKDHEIKTLPLNTIQGYVNEFCSFARRTPDLKFFMTKIGAGLAGYTVEDIAPLFRKNVIPENVWLPVEFW
jgi:hypothetical protein